MKLIALSTFWVLLLPLLTVQAEVYKCTENGRTTFSDNPCADDAELLELEIYQPSSEDVQKQNALTATFSEQSRVADITSLRAKNDALEQQIIQLEKQRDKELEKLREKTYVVDENWVGTTEQGLFKKMDQVVADYQQQIQQVVEQINKNKKNLQSLYDAAPQVE